MIADYVPSILFTGINQTMFDVICHAWDKYKAVLVNTPDVVSAIKELANKKFNLICFVLPDDSEEERRTINQITLLRDMTPTPIVVLTHHPFDPQLMMKALDEGADDFQVCPGTIEEASAIGMALIRRYTQFNTGKKERPFTMLISENIIISVAFRKVFVRGKEVELMKKEFDILALLIRNQGRVFTYEQIFRRVWGEDYADNSNDILWRQIHSLRKKLQIEPNMPDFIETVREVGYRYNP